ncbi:hypothetical protein TIFTF001_024717 [Ficus carica]|uniref:Uncharacterized protein n=1 Tax=Ficus carica TaxID=3494 RepID=A0AA88AMX4_FICCA|nr:hypothetical protein TIFTF001_024717 [Ficus carica]
MTNDRNRMTGQSSAGRRHVVSELQEIKDWPDVFSYLILVEYALNAEVHDPAHEVNFPYLALLSCQSLASHSLIVWKSFPGLLSGMSPSRLVLSDGLSRDTYMAMSVVMDNLLKMFKAARGLRVSHRVSIRRQSKWKLYSLCRADGRG